MLDHVEQRAPLPLIQLTAVGVTLKLQPAVPLPVQSLCGIQGMQDPERDVGARKWDAGRVQSLARSFKRCLKRRIAQGLVDQPVGKRIDQRIAAIRVVMSESCQCPAPLWRN